MRSTMHQALQRLPGSAASDEDAVLQAEQLCLRLLRGESSTWNLAAVPGGDEVATEVFLDCLRHHGIQALVYERRALLQGAPAALWHGLRAAVMAGSAWHLRDRELLQELCRRLEERGVAALFFKGVALAWSLYGNPAWRSRSDADLLVRESDLATAEEVLASLGYTVIPASASVVYYQLDYQLTAPEGGLHCIDLHWRLNNAEVLAQLFTHEELFAASRALPALAPSARRVGDVHALLIAAFHRLVHEGQSGERYLWLLDVDQIARQLEAPAWQEALRLARERGMAATLRAALVTAAAMLGTPLPDGAVAELAAAGEGHCDRYLAAGGLRRVLLEVSACRGQAERARYLRRLFLPPPDYMRAKYADAHFKWLPWLHVRRTVAGGLKLAGLRRGSA